MPPGLLSAVGMLTVTLLILTLAWWVTKQIAVRGQGAGVGLPSEAGASFRVLGRIALSRNASLALVQLRDECCLLGVTDGQIMLLKEWQGEEAEAWIRAREQPPSPGAFWEILRENLRKGS